MAYQNRTIERILVLKDSEPDNSFAVANFRIAIGGDSVELRSQRGRLVILERSLTEIRGWYQAAFYSPIGEENTKDDSVVGCFHVFPPHNNHPLKTQN